MTGYLPMPTDGWTLTENEYHEIAELADSRLPGNPTPDMAFLAIDQAVVECQPFTYGHNPHRVAMARFLAERGLVKEFCGSWQDYDMFSLRGIPPLIHKLKADVAGILSGTYTPPPDTVKKRPLPEPERVKPVNRDWAFRPVAELSATNDKHRFNLDTTTERQLAPDTPQASLTRQNSQG